MGDCISDLMRENEGLKKQLSEVELECLRTREEMGEKESIIDRVREHLQNNFPDMSILDEITKIRVNEWKEELVKKLENVE